MTFLGHVKRLTRYSFIAFLCVLLMISAFLWYITTDSFQSLVRGRLIAAMERATGGRAELGSFHVVPLRFEVEVRNLTIHGREGPSELPLAHVDSMSAVVDLSSVLGAKIAFRSLVLEHPVLHIRFYADGTTNQPARQQQRSNFDQLFAISVDRLEVHRGELLWQDQRVPLEFICNDLRAKLDYSFLHQRYAGNVSVGKAETGLEGYRPFAWSAQSDFSISKDEVQLHSLSVNSGGSHVHASGTIHGFLQPIVQGNYDLTLDLQEAAAIARDPHFSSGTMRLQGTARWSSETYSTGGDFDVKDAAWGDPNLAIKGVSAAGKFTLTPQRLAFSQVQGKALRGTFSSEGEIANWNTSPPRSKRIKSSGQRGAIAFKARDVALSDVLASLGPRFRPLKNTKFSGTITTSSEISWKDSFANAELSSAVSVTPPGRPGAGEIGLTASTHFKYSARPLSLQISDFSARTQSTQLVAAGNLASASALKISFSTQDLRELRPITSQLFPEGLPVAVAGKAVVNGTVTGSVDQPSFSGGVQVQNFDTAIPSKGAKEVSVHWDSLQADVQLSATALALHNTKVIRGDADLRIDGTLALNHWRPTPANAMRFHVDAQNVDAGDLAHLAGYDIEASGTIDSRLDISGTVSRPQGSGTLTWRDGAVQGRTFDLASASIQLSGNRAEFSSLKIDRENSQVSGAGWYEFSGHSFQFDLNGSNFDLAEFTPMERSRIKVSGTMDFTAKASGTLDVPVVDAHFHLRKIALNNETAGDFQLDAVTRGATTHLTGHSEFADAQLSLEGDVRLRDMWPARIDVHFNHLDIDSFLESYLRGQVTGHSAVAGDLVLQGPLRDLQSLSLTGAFSDAFADIEKVKIRNDGPVKFRVSERMLNVDSLHLLGENTDFAVTGSMQLTGERQMNFRGTGSIGLQLVQTYDPDLTGSGTLSGEVIVAGPSSAPLVHGKVVVRDAALSDINLPSALSELNGELSFNQNQITIEKLTGRTGGGTVSFTGHAQLNGKQVNFDLSAAADSVRLRYPPGVSSTATAALRWNGSSSGSLLSGDITVTKLGVTPGFDFAAYLERSIQTASLPQTDPVLNNIRLDLHVLTSPELQMQTSVLRLRGDADLRVRGSAAKPVLLGRADVFEGEAYFNGTKYRLERGGVTFGGATGTSGGVAPFVDLEATTHVRDYDITLSITGPADRPKMNYRSEPPLPTNDIIGLLAFGQTSEESAQLQQTSQSAFSQQASNAMLAAALNATLNNRAQRLFGNSRIKIDPQGLETETSPTQTGPAVTIEQQVKDNLTITYTTNVAQTSQQVIRAEYYVSRNVSVVAIRDQNGVVSFDVRIRRRKR